MKDVEKKVNCQALFKISSSGGFGRKTQGFGHINPDLKQTGNDSI